HLSRRLEQRAVPVGLPAGRGLARGLAAGARVVPGRSSTRAALAPGPALGATRLGGGAGRGGRAGPRRLRGAGRARRPRPPRRRRASTAAAMAHRVAASRPAAGPSARTARRRAHPVAPPGWARALVADRRDLDRVERGTARAARVAGRPGARAGGARARGRAR